MEFVEFIQAIVGQNAPPRIIEIHPPFNDYCESIPEFCETYGLFEAGILSLYPDTELLIENRFGTRYRTGKFLISSYDDVARLASYLDKTDLRLKIVLDLPQIISRMGDVRELSINRLEEMFAGLRQCRGRIGSIHLWGKRRTDTGRMAVRVGNLDTYFQGNDRMKQAFLEGLFNLFDDGIPRYFVPEVNSGNSDVASIVEDLLSAGFTFRTDTGR